MKGIKIFTLGLCLWGSCSWGSTHTASPVFEVQKTQLTPKEMEAYKSPLLWNPEKTLQENQENVETLFLTQVCDLENLAADEQGECLTPQHISEIKENIKIISQNSTGCNLLRMILSVIQANDPTRWGRRQLLLFAPANEPHLSFGPNPLSGDCFIRWESAPIKNIIVWNVASKKVELLEIYPKDVSFFHELLHYLHCLLSTDIASFLEQKQSVATVTLIKSCVNSADLLCYQYQKSSRKGALGNVSSKSFKGCIARTFFDNDEEAGTAMGIMPDGKINPLCENGYLLGRLGKVRGCYRQYQEESQEKNQTMSVDVKIFGQSYLTCISQQAEFGKGHFKHK